MRSKQLHTQITAANSSSNNNYNTEQRQNGNKSVELCTVPSGNKESKKENNNSIK